MCDQEFDDEEDENYEIEPNRAAFAIRYDSINYYDSGPVLFVADLDDPSNDNIRDVKHPEFEKLFGNSSEIGDRRRMESW